MIFGTAVLARRRRLNRPSPVFNNSAWISHAPSRMLPHYLCILINGALPSITLSKGVAVPNFLSPPKRGIYASALSLDL